MVESYHPQYQPETPLSAREVTDNGQELILRAMTKPNIIICFSHIEIRNLNYFL